MTIKAGILSDTHLTQTDDIFKKQVELCFADCDVIIHAGDLTNIAVLDVFNGKTVHAVHGNMCDASAYHALPDKKRIDFKGFSIGLAHGVNLGRDIEVGLINLFADADCIIYGHTHHPVCRRYGHILVINPGTFTGTGRYGAPGTYAVLEAGGELRATIHEVPRP